MLTATDPHTGKVVRELPRLSVEALAERTAAAADAFETWRHASFSERGEVLRRVARRLRDDVGRHALLMTEEMGKPAKEAGPEVEKAAWCAEHYAEHAEAYLAREIIASDARESYVQYLPLGPVLGILPWNAPYWLAFRFGAPALMAGNTCLMKHDPHVPGCADAIASVFREELEKAGWPAGVFQNLPLATPDVETAIRDPHVQAVSFTGSDRAGSAVAAIAGSEIKPSVLELGGSDPCIVLADADLEKAADVITRSRIINAGQSCIAAKRIIVDAPAYERMVGLLRDRLSRLRVGDPRDEGTDVGPIAREDLRDALHRQVRETVDAGARCLLGGQPSEGPGYYYPVTLLADVTSEMAAWREETFGPVAVLIRADDPEQALAMANDTPYGLAAGLWTDAARGEAMAREIFAGQVAINGIVKTDPRLPSGGIKRSGFGRELGPHGIREFVNAQQVWIG
jgi:succinate-semialdehyde dehydrogenase/glutarate-semialdehyde dehydrogenase